MKLKRYCHQNLLPIWNPHWCFNLDLFDCGVEWKQVRNDGFYSTHFFHICFYTKSPTHMFRHSSVYYLFNVGDRCLFSLTDYSHSVSVSVFKQLYIWAMSHFELAHIPFFPQGLFLFLIMYICVFESVYVYHLYSNTHRGHKRAFDPVHLKLEVAMSHHLHTVDLGSLETPQTFLFTNSSLQSQFSFWQCILIFSFNISWFFYNNKLSRIL